MVNVVEPVVPLSERRARRLAAAILAAHHGGASGRLTLLTGGLNNRVLRVDRSQRLPLVIRLHGDAGQAAVYEDERRAMRLASDAGIPVPMVHGVGVEDGCAWLVADCVRGINGTQAADRFPVLKELGSLARRLHGLSTRGFGRGTAGGFATWATFLDDDIRVNDRLEYLRAAELLTAPTAAALHRIVDEMRHWKKRPALQHGDLRLKNVIVRPADGRIAALIDWEDCLSAPPPYWDLAIALHDLGPDGKEAFLEGYGLTPHRFSALAPALWALNTLNYAWALRAATAAGRRQQVKWLKARLQGAFDIGPGPTGGLR